MTVYDPDDALRSAIRDLRDRDAGAAPAFDAVLARRRRAIEFDTDRVIGLAVAASVLVATSIGVAEGVSARRRIVVPLEVQQLSTWRPMTDVLLETHNSRFLSQTSPLDDSVVPWTPITFEDQ